ncbi:uncharacterized protein LOC100902404 [Galendromus occidentalis]|uniref:Uncharacterized protein LOC100902404 n=1 Tax=Galendromus occidentalis TaxID=34638 RepID=A0AAJ7SDY0_9ACAR|nr:uncharacterized protein LOC100902404 [Galendromus occidentalis]
MLRTLLVKQFIGDLSVDQCLDVSDRQDISVIVSNQIQIWSLPKYPTDGLFPMQLETVTSADAVLNLTTGLFSQATAETKFSNNDAMYVYLDHTMSPEDELHGLQRRSFRMGRWSPAALSSTECVLATLQVDHRLRLHRYIQREWQVVTDVSEALSEFVRKENQSEISQLADIRQHWEHFTLARSIVHRMAIVNFAWAVPSHFDRRLHLALALKDGSLRFVVVQVSGEATELTISPSSFRPITGNEAQLAVVCLRCVALNEDVFVVLVGYSNGLCHAVKVQRDCTYDFGEAVALWSEDDDVTPKEMFCTARENRLIVTIVKGAWLCLAAIDLETMRTVGDVLPIKTEGRSECTSCHRTNIPAADDYLESLLLTYPNEKTLHCVISENLTVEVRNLSMEVTHGYRAVGSGESYNGVLLYVVEKMACMSDKLMLTGANKLKIISTVPIENATATILSIFEHSGNMLFQIKDYLDILFYNYQKTERLPEDLSFYLREENLASDILKNYKTTQILIIRLLLLWSPPAKRNTKVLSELAKETLRRRYRFILANNHNQDGLSEVQRRSLVLFADFLQDSEPELSREAYVSLKCTSPSRNARDSCELCDGEVRLNLDDPSIGSCSRGHRTSRCMYSLLLCRTIDQMSRCLTCGWYALNGEIWEKPVECLLCGLPLSAYP